MVKQAGWMIVLALVAGVAFAAGSGTKADDAAPKKAADFTLADQDGKNVSLKDFSGKIVVLQWVNWGCPFDRRHHTAGTLEKLAAKYKDKGVVFLGINSTKSANVSVNKKQATAYGLSYPVLDDHAGTVGKAYGAKTTPDLRVIAKDGAIAYAGAMDDDPRDKSPSPTNYVDKAVGELLAGKAVSVPKTKPYGCGVKYAN
ncbi:redoxin domain-containing protein [bacterium]|nr:redoxin domain-containing protein [bacterium]